LENQHGKWIEMVIDMAKENAAKGGGPFAALIVRNGELIASGVNQVPAVSDPTAHAELLAISEACRKLKRTDLSDCDLYASGEPCPMCIGAIYWARPRHVYYACSKKDAMQAVGFPDRIGHFYTEIQLPPAERSIPFQELPSEQKLEPFFTWLKHRKSPQNK
jgi:guanine deaminase